MPDKKIIGIFSSPYEESRGTDDIIFNRKKAIEHGRNPDGFGNIGAMSGYSNNKNNIGNLKSSNSQNLDFDITKYHKCLEPLEWHGCYDGDGFYKQFFDPSSYSHPAKISPKLVIRIFEHLKKLGLMKDNSVVIDCMSGSGRIPLLASMKGHTSIGIELEEHFVSMSDKNKKYAENKLGRKLDMVTIKGDSRKLSEVLKNNIFCRCNKK